MPRRTQPTKTTRKATQPLAQPTAQPLPKKEKEPERPPHTPGELQEVERQMETLLKRTLDQLELAFEKYHDLKLAAQCDVLITCGEIQELVDKHYDPMARFERQAMLNLGIEHGDLEKVRK